MFKMRIDICWICFLYKVHYLDQEWDQALDKGKNVDQALRGLQDLAQFKSKDQDPDRCKDPYQALDLISIFVFWMKFIIKFVNQVWYKNIQ